MLLHSMCNIDPMSGTTPPGTRHDEFTAWAKEQGVQINGVGPANIVGHGLGIVAQRRIEVVNPCYSIKGQQAQCGGRSVNCFATFRLLCF